MRGLEPVHSQLGMYMMWNSNLIKFRMTWKPKLLVSSRIFPPLFCWDFRTVEIWWSPGLLLGLDIWASHENRKTSLNSRKEHWENAVILWWTSTPNSNRFRYHGNLNIYNYIIIYIYIHCRSNQHIQWSFKNNGKISIFQLQVGEVLSKAPELVESGPCRSLVWDAWKGVYGG